MQYLLKDVPDFLGLALDHLLRTADGVNVTEFLEATNDERLKEHERHLLGQTALVELEFRADDDDRTAGVIDAFTEQVLTEATGLALEHVGEGFQRTIARAGDRAAMATVVELETISPISLKVVKVTLDKLAPQQSEVTLDVDAKELKKKCIILIDDVLNTGRTLAYGMKPFLTSEVKKIEVAVLVNRSNTLFPITPTYTGYQLTTILNDHVEVVLGKKSAVYLL